MKTIRHQLLVGLLGSALGCTAIAGYAMFVTVSEEANELFDYQLRQLAANAPERATPVALAPAHGDPEEDIVVQRWDQRGRLLYGVVQTKVTVRRKFSGFGAILSLLNQTTATA